MPAPAFLTPLKQPLSKEDLDAANEYLSVLTPEEILRWGDRQRFGLISNDSVRLDGGRCD